jgi:hypothetical protein
VSAGWGQDSAGERARHAIQRPSCDRPRWVLIETQLSAERVPAVALSRLMRRDLRRAALFRCRTPFDTPRSSAEIAATARVSTSAVPAAMPRRNLLTLVLTAERMDRLRIARRALRRASFLDEAMLASDEPPEWNEPDTFRHGA